LYVWTN